MRECDRCGRLFDRKNNRQVYCSRECQLAYNKDGKRKPSTRLAQKGEYVRAIKEAMANDAERTARIEKYTLRVEQGLPVTVTARRVTRGDVIF